MSPLGFHTLPGKSLRLIVTRDSMMLWTRQKVGAEAVLVGPRSTLIRLVRDACVRGLLHVMSDTISASQGSTQLTPDMALDERLYDLTEEEHTFFKQQTGIQGEDELKSHLVQVQNEAYEVCLHP
jgi:hypothetical protein